MHKVSHNDILPLTTLIGEDKQTIKKLGQEDRKALNSMLKSFNNHKLIDLKPEDRTLETLSSRITQAKNSPPGKKENFIIHFFHSIQKGFQNLFKQRVSSRELMNNIHKAKINAENQKAKALEIDKVRDSLVATSAQFKKFIEQIETDTYPTEGFSDEFRKVFVDLLRSQLEYYNTTSEALDGSKKMLIYMEDPNVDSLIESYMKGGRANEKTMRFIMQNKTITVAKVEDYTTLCRILGPNNYPPSVARNS